MNTNVKRHRGRITQTFIYLGKLFRMFLFQNDWKVLPMSAIIAGLVAFAVGSNLYVTMEGTLTGAFALACVCIWNGFFNSIQVICRERAIVKREHRSGLHISSYIVAHMIYQAILCVLQVVIMIFVCMSMGVAMPLLEPPNKLSRSILVCISVYSGRVSSSLNGIHFSKVQNVTPSNLNVSTLRKNA